MHILRYERKNCDWGRQIDCIISSSILNALFIESFLATLSIPFDRGEIGYHAKSESDIPELNLTWLNIIVKPVALLTFSTIVRGAKIPLSGW